MNGIPPHFFLVAGFLMVFLVVFLVPHPFVPHAISTHLLQPFDSTYLSLLILDLSRIFVKLLIAIYLTPGWWCYP